MAAIFGEGKIFGKLQRVHSLDTLWVENYSKIQNGRHFWGGENFWKIGKIAFLTYPVGRKF